MRRTAGNVRRRMQAEGERQNGFLRMLCRLQAGIALLPVTFLAL